MKLVHGSSSPVLGRKVAEEMEVKPVEVEHRVFPDGEQYHRIHGDIAGEDVVLINTTKPDSSLLETFFLLDALSTANSITLVIPYFAYSRQDRVFLEGEAVSARVIMKMLGEMTDRLITVDIHAPHVFEWYRNTAENILPSNSMAEKLSELGIDFVLSPDRGALHRAKAVADIMKVPFDHLDKTRLSGTEVEMKEKPLDVEGKKVAIVDDIISTGGTIARASEMLKKSGARAVYAVCTHGLFIGPAIERLTKSTDGFMSTDTIESKYSEISVAREIARAIKGTGDWVTKL